MPGNGDVLGALSLIVSVETSLLDSRPLVEVCTELPAEEVLPLDQRGVLYRLPGAEISYAELSAPGEFQNLRLERQEQTFRTSRWKFFAHFLEKGVIRRARLRGVFLPREDDVARADACYEELLIAELPLTA